MNNNQTKGKEDTEIDFQVQKLAEQETKSREALEKAYLEGYEIGFADGANTGYEKGECETWDVAYSAGYREAKQEQ